MDPLSALILIALLGFLGWFLYFVLRRAFPKISRLTASVVVMAGVHAVILLAGLAQDFAPKPLMLALTPLVLLYPATLIGFLLAPFFTRSILGVALIALIGSAFPVAMVLDNAAKLAADPNHDPGAGAVFAILLSQTFLAVMAAILVLRLSALALEAAGWRRWTTRWMSGAVVAGLLALAFVAPSIGSQSTAKDLYEREKTETSSPR